MAVVIDQMNVDVAEPPPKRRGDSDGGGSDEGGGGGQQPKPVEVEHAWQQQVERAERVWAH